MDTTEEIPRFSYVSCAALTDVGRKRKNNEDNYGTFPDAGVFCVADGMGGARDGEVASRIVVEHLAGALRNWEKISPPIPIEDRLALVDKCLDAASLWINQYAASHDATGCGTTFVGVVLDPGKPGHAVAVHAGDSRLYRIHRHKITQITRDHSVANMTGVKDENELNPVFRNMILRAVGIKSAVELERTPFEVASGDWILICSDGLTKMVDDKSIAKILVAAEGGKAAVNTLVAEANRCGGRDNITVVLLRVGELPQALPVHARLTEAEFLTCMGVAGSETPATTETAFTMPTGSGSTEQNALDASKEDGAASAGWLSEDEDSDNTPVPAAAGRDDGENGGGGKKTEGGSPTSAKDAPVAPGESPDDTKTTEDLLPPTDPDMKTTEDIPPPAASERTTDDMPPTPVGRHWHRAVFLVLIGAVALAVAVGVGVGKLQKAREKARLAEIARAKEAEEARLAAIVRAEEAFKEEAGAILLPLGALAKENGNISRSDDPESYTNDLFAAKRRLDEIWDEARTAGVTNESFYSVKLDTYGMLSNNVASAIANRRSELRRAEAERLAQAVKAFEKAAGSAIRQSLPDTLETEIGDSDNPDVFAFRLGVAENVIDAEWAKAREKGVRDENVLKAMLDKCVARSNAVAKAIFTRRGRLDAEFKAREEKYEDQTKVVVSDIASYEKALAAINRAVTGLPSYSEASPWKAKYDDLRGKYGELEARISASTAKIEVKNDGELPLSVTLGGTTVAIAQGKSHTFDQLAVWTDHTLSAVAAPGRDAPAAHPDDYTLTPVTQSTKGPGSSVPVSFLAVYKGDPTLVVKNPNPIPIRVNGKTIPAKGSHEFRDGPRMELALNYACDDDDYEFEDGATKSITVTLGNAGTRMNLVAAALVKRAGGDTPPSGGDAPTAPPQTVADATSLELEKVKAEFRNKFSLYKSKAKLSDIVSFVKDHNYIPGFYWPACFKPHPEGEDDKLFLSMMNALTDPALTIKRLSLTNPEAIADIKEEYDTFVIVARGFRDTFPKEKPDEKSQKKAIKDCGMGDGDVRQFLNWRGKVRDL